MANDTIQVRRGERCYDEDHGPNHCYICGGSGWLAIGDVIELTSREDKERSNSLSMSRAKNYQLMRQDLPPL